MFAAALDAIESDVIAVHDERCISVRNRNAQCSRCAEACTSGCMCAVFCPTGAIEKIDEERGGTFGVVHRPAACMQCRLCESICPAGAIHVSSLVPTEQFMGKQAVVFPMQKPSWNR